MNDTAILRCPLCNNRLYSKKCGLACKTHQCLFYWKVSGWCLKDSVWVYGDRSIDQDIRWDKAHPDFSYPPLKKGIDKRHLAAMRAAVQKDKSLRFRIPEKYGFVDTEEVSQ